jgi:peptidoglycan L-alanyl-D-glutamate endopeptidase CwlK
MEMKEFGTRSKEKLSTCHRDLQIIAEESLKVSQVDFGISEGHRTVEKQQEYFNTGKSKIDGINKKGKHNHQPSLAMDVYAYVPGKPKLAFNVSYLAYLGGVITSVAKRLLNEGKISNDIRWGYNWDSDGEIGTDQRFQDMPHIELI